jgi:hypothetical protein
MCHAQDNNAVQALAPNSLGDSVTSSIRMGFSVHTRATFIQPFPDGETEPRRMLGLAGESIKDLNLPTRRLTALGRSAAMGLAARGGA